MVWIVMIVVGLIAAVLVVLPLRARAVEYDWDGTRADASRVQRTARIEADVARYREALRAGTVCARCAQANPSGSRFCGDCGKPLRDAAAPTVATNAELTSSS
jgi:hypothetical protein